MFELPSGQGASGRGAGCSNGWHTSSCRCAVSDGKTTAKEKASVLLDGGSSEELVFITSRFTRLLELIILLVLWRVDRIGRSRFHSGRIEILLAWVHIRRKMVILRVRIELRVDQADQQQNGHSKNTMHFVFQMVMALQGLKQMWRCYVLYI